MNRPSWIRRAACVLPLAALLLAPGCSRSLTTSVAPPADSELASALDSESSVALDSRAGRGPSGTRPPSRNLFPLEVGNTWSYQSAYQVFDGEGTPVEPAVLAEARRRITRTGRWLGRTYYVALDEVTGEDGSFAFETWYRQDGTGLYEAASIGSSPSTAALDSGHDAMVDRAVARLAPERRDAARGALLRQVELLREVKRAMATAQSPGDRGTAPIFSPSEIQRLAYPLRTGNQWVVRDYPRYVSRVVRAVQLATSAGDLPAWEIQMTSELFGPLDFVFLYFGAAGYLGMDVFLADESSGGKGTPALMLRSEFRERLTAYSLAEAGNIGVARNGTP